MSLRGSPCPYRVPMCLQGSLCPYRTPLYSHRIPMPPRDPHTPTGSLHPICCPHAHPSSRLPQNAASLGSQGWGLSPNLTLSSASPPCPHPPPTYVSPQAGATPAQVSSCLGAWEASAAAGCTRLGTQRVALALVRGGRGHALYPSLQARGPGGPPPTPLHRTVLVVLPLQLLVVVQSWGFWLLGHLCREGIHGQGAQGGTGVQAGDNKEQGGGT